MDLVWDGGGGSETFDFGPPLTGTEEKELEVLRLPLR